MPGKAFCELNEAGDRIEIYFPYNPQLKEAVKAISGRKYVGKDQNPPNGVHWTVPTSLEAAQKLRAIFGDDLQLGNAVRIWGREENQRRRNLSSLTTADDAELERLPKVAPIIMRVINGDPIPEFGLPKRHPLSKKRDPRPYQKADIKMMSLTNVINANQPGCMAWDTIVEINRGRSGKSGNSYKLTIAQLFARFNGHDAANFNFGKSTLVRIRARTSDGYIRLVEIKGVHDSGRKQTYRVTTETGRNVRATHDHPFLTPNGWCKLEELRSGDEVYVDGGRITRGRKPKRGEHMINLQHHPYARQRKRGNQIAYHRVVAEATLNGMTPEEFITAVRGTPKYSKRSGLPKGAKDLKFLPSTTIVHHDDGDHNNNDPSNLVVLNGHSEHAKLHGLWQNCTAVSATERVVSIEKDERTRTYDIELEGAPHNFLANGFVVHNTGKTLEAIGALVEAGIDEGPQLVCGPRTSLVNVWKVEVERLLGHPMFTSENPKDRRAQFEIGMKLAKKDKPCWLGTIFGDLRVKKVAAHNATPEIKKAAEQHPLYARKDHKGNVYHFQSDLHREFVRIFWRSFNIDEFHKSGLNNPMSLFTLGTDLIKAERQYRMSGTPMGGKPIKLFPVLRSIEPKQFSSKWRWADEWLEVEGGYAGHKMIGGLKPGKEEEFYKYHALVMVRRMKREALPGLPAKVIEIVPCDMTPKQAKQYAKFSDDAEVRIEGTGGSKTVIGDCILAEYTRLKQFANAYCELNEKNEVCPTEDSGKLPYLLEKLDEQGLRREDPEPGARAIVASQSKRMVKMVSAWLHKQGIANDMLTGDTKDSKPIIDRFHSEDDAPYVIVMTTQTGGVSLNLEEANSVHILDESWNPDDEEQLEDRGDRGGRETSLICYYYRTVGTIQEYIAEVADGKKITNRTVLDVYRQMEKAHDKAIIDDLSKMRAA